MGKKSAGKSTALTIAPPAPVALEGEYLGGEKELIFEPIPHNDPKAIADAVNEWRESRPAIAEMNQRLLALEEKLESLIAAWSEPDEAAADGGEDANQH